MVKIQFDFEVNVDAIPDVQVEIVAIGAHPDDTEIGVGGTLAKFAKQGISTGIIDLTNAEPTPANSKYRSLDDFDPDYAARRLEESQKAAKILGLTSRVTLDLQNRALFDTFEARCKLATVFRVWKPKIAMVMYNKTVMASPDHYEAQKIVEAAIFYSRLTKWGKVMGNLPVHSLKNLLYFPVRAAGILHPQGESGQLTSFFIDISEELEQKKEAIAVYESQFKDQGKEKFIHYIVARNKDYGRFIGVKAAEHLASPVPLKLDNLSFFM